MVIVLQATRLAERCFLSEVLFWLALNRLPLPIDCIDGDEFRFSEENELCASTLVQDEVTDAECEAADIPYNPRSNEDNHISSVKILYDRIIDNVDAETRELFLKEREKAIELEAETQQWNIQFAEYLEYFQAKLFLELHDGIARIGN